MDRRAFVAACAACVIAPRVARAYSPAQAEIVYDAAQGRVVHQMDATRPLPPASLAKMMTLFIAFDALASGALAAGASVPFSARAAARPATKLGLGAGEAIAVSDALPALAVHSCNDVATALAERMAGTEERFAAAMTLRAASLGLASTRYGNASGLPHPDNRTTALDVAVLGVALMARHPGDWPLLGIRQWSYGGRTYDNTNHLLGAYPGMDGGKTGFCSASGFNLFASAERGGRRLVAVVMGGASARERDDRMTDLLDAGFSGTTLPPRARP